ncbi:nucleotidyltransferase [Pseudoalteromonas sp. SSMSWG5]|uniref:nucleotidyltransferase domain-containing protein n=1 Tax=Pseudoalteromonas sp. SSMSWG5 TaxID=3139396 RepID=UPI003BAC101D
MPALFTNARNLSRQQKIMLTDVIDRIFSGLDLTDTQRERIETAYKAVGSYLASCDEPLLEGAKVYAQGSVRLRTAVKPLGRDEFDVDLILFLPNAKNASRDEIVSVVKQHLLKHNVYGELLEELPRGFRINYKGDYHLDITPAKEYDSAQLLGYPLWVVDKRSEFKESNPEGMASTFDQCCLLKPKLVVQKSLYAALNSRSVEELPDQSIKHLLNRIVQIIKRHRDVWAQDKGNIYAQFKPISVLLTTLASKAYKEVVEAGKEYDNEFDLILDVIELMPHHIESELGQILVANPAMRAENYAEKWNRVKDNEGFKLQQAFFEWHKAAVLSFENMISDEKNGLDNLFSSLSSSFGSRAVAMTRDKYIAEINNAREKDKLSVILGSGALTVTQSKSASANVTQAITPVRRNQFYGD